MFCWLPFGYDATPALAVDHLNPSHFEEGQISERIEPWIDRISLPLKCVNW
jgi:hypothetical protein